VTAREYLQEWAGDGGRTLHEVLREGWRARRCACSLPDCPGWVPVVAGAPGALSLMDIIGAQVLALPSWKCLDCTEHGSGWLSPMLAQEHENYTAHRVEVSVPESVPKTGIFVHPDGSTEAVPVPSPGGSVSQLDDSVQVSNRVGVEQPGEGLDLAAIRGRARAASDMVHALCQPRGTEGSREWVMSIPARPSHDPDLVIAASLRDIEDLCALVEGLFGRLPASSEKGETQRADTLGGGREVPCVYRFGCAHPDLCKDGGLCR
jgi:hypothetical protein